MDLRIMLALATLLLMGSSSDPCPAAVLEDCNRNGIDDSVDIAYGSSSDIDENGVPDECEDDPESKLQGLSGPGTT
jgi:hypothetical protein